MLMLMLMRDGCHANVGRSIVRIEVEKRLARSRLYSIPQSSKMMLAVAQVDQPVSGLLAVAVSYVFTFSCFFYIYIFFLYFFFFNSYFFNSYFYPNFFFFLAFYFLFFPFFIVKSLSMSIGVIGLG